jgi:uncharacterized phage protein (TIGR02220 family)
MTTINSVIEYLSHKTSGNFESNYPYTIELIQKLIDAGYHLEDFKYVIDVKYKEWKGTKFEIYLRPSTLFGNKFESYLNAKREDTKIEKIQKAVNAAEKHKWNLK